MAISASDLVYTYYLNGTRSIGSSSDLDGHSAPVAYSIPGGRSPANIVAIAIAKSNNYVYAWYDDGKVSVGTSTNLGARTGPGKYWSAERTYTHAPGRTPSGIVGMAIQPGTDHVFTWYSDGYATEGTTSNLDAYRAPFRYTRHGVLKSVFPANPLPVGSYEDLTAPYDTTPLEGLEINAGSADNVVAAGNRYFGVSFDASVYFYRRDGTSTSPTRATRIRPPAATTSV